MWTILAILEDILFFRRPRVIDRGLFEFHNWNTQSIPIQDPSTMCKWKRHSMHKQSDPAISGFYQIIKGEKEEMSLRDYLIVVKRDESPNLV